LLFWARIKTVVDESCGVKFSFPNALYSPFIRVWTSGLLHIRGAIKKFCNSYGRLNVDKFQLSQMLPTHMSSVV